MATNRPFPSKTPEYQREYMRKYRAENPEYVAHERARSRVFMKAHRERNFYGLAPGDYERMIVEQEHRCAICSQLTDRLEIDHDHSTGQTRGLLCGHCNKALGLMGESIERLMRAAAYLGEYEEEEVE